MNHPLAQKFKNFFQAIDLHSAYPSLLIFGNQKYSSILGVLFTMLASALTFAYLQLDQIIITTLQEVKELVQLPQTILSEHLVTETSPFPLSSHNFTLAVSVGKIQSNPLKTIDKYFTIQVENCQRTRFLNTTTNQIDEQFQEIFITCKNSTEKQDCTTMDQINQELANGYYVVHMNDSLIQMSNPQNIQQNFIKMQFTTFQISASKTIYSGFRIIQSITDNGVLTNNIEEDQFLVQQYFQESFANYNQDYLVNHFIIIDNKYTSYQRSYIKLLTILSKIGGLWQLIFIIFGIITKPFIQTEMRINLANRLFRFQQEVNDLTQSVKKIQVLFKFQFIYTNKNLDKYALKPGQKLPNSLQMIQSIFNILQFLFGFHKKRINSLNQANQRIQENLKQILLTFNQRILFDLIPTPLINGQQENKIDQDQHSNKEIIIGTSQQNKDYLERFIEAFKSFFRFKICLILMKILDKKQLNVQIKK